MLVYLYSLTLTPRPTELEPLLALAAEGSFNSISIDGDTSTNDTVLLLASGASGVKLDATGSGRIGEAFANALGLVCNSLAHQIVDDGEGVTHLVNLHITGAATESRCPPCRQGHRPLAAEQDRMVERRSRTGAASSLPPATPELNFDPNTVTVWIGPHLVLANGLRVPEFDEAATHQTMLEREYTIRLDLGVWHRRKPSSSPATSPPNTSP